MSSFGRVSYMLHHFSVFSLIFVFVFCLGALFVWLAGGCLVLVFFFLFLWKERSNLARSMAEERQTHCLGAWGDPFSLLFSQQCCCTLRPNISYRWEVYQGTDDFTAGMKQGLCWKHWKGEWIADTEGVSMVVTEAEGIAPVSFTKLQNYPSSALFFFFFFLL